MLEIVVGFEGSCPQSDAGVRVESERRFRVFPSWRPTPGISEEAVGRSTRLGFKVVNDGASIEPVELLIDWQYDDAPPTDRPSFASREEYMSYRDFVVVKGPGDSDWRTVMGDVDASVAGFRLDVRPGETEVHWHPPYTYTQGEAFVESLRQRPMVEVEKAGQTNEGRSVWLLRITDDSPRAKKPALIQARAHAYESAGSYAMEGMVEFLLGDDAWAAAARREYAFHIIPMANPDGVFNGMGRLTAPRGANVLMVNGEPDRTRETIRAIVDRAQPQLYVDLHNWQNKHCDGLLGLRPDVRDLFVKYMPDQWDAGKYWSVREPWTLPEEPGPNEMFSMYCRRHFDAVTVAFEFPWFGRTIADVRATGRKTLWALLRALDEPPADAAWR